MNNTLEQLLSVKKIKPTAMRLLVLDYLLRQTAAVSLQDVERDFQHADRITLYRTLKTFEEKGMIHTIKDGTRATKYALCTEVCANGEHYDLHLHFSCTRCGETYCLPKILIQEIALPNKFVVEEWNLTAKGICDRCHRN